MVAAARAKCMLVHPTDTGSKNDIKYLMVNPFARSTSDIDPNNNLTTIDKDEGLVHWPVHVDAPIHVFGDPIYHRDQKSIAGLDQPYFLHPNPVDAYQRNQQTHRGKTAEDMTRWERCNDWFAIATEAVIKDVGIEADNSNDDTMPLSLALLLDDVTRFNNENADAEFWHRRGRRSS